MSPANLSRHEDICRKTRGIILNGKELSVKDLSYLRRKLKKLGWTTERYLRFHNEQDNKCYICGEENKRDGVLCADHCHHSGLPRALLCNRCNTGIGAFEENVELMKKCIRYIEKFNHYKIPK